MIEIIDGTNRVRFSALAEQMYHLRHRGQVGVFGWNFSVPLPESEVDQFDTKDSILILEVDNADNVTGGLRLVPTTCRNVIGTYFCHAIANGKPLTDRRIYELSHYFLTEAQQVVSPRQRLGGLFCAAFDYGLRMDLTHLTLICDMTFLPTLLSFRWNIIPLGLPITYEDKHCVALLIELCHIALALTREECDLSPFARSEASH